MGRNETLGAPAHAAPLGNAASIAAAPRNTPRRDHNFVPSLMPLPYSYSPARDKPDALHMRASTATNRRAGVRAAMPVFVPVIAPLFARPSFSPSFSPLGNAASSTPLGVKIWLTKAQTLP